MLLGVVTRFPREPHGVDAPALPFPTASAPPALRAGSASGGRGLSGGAGGAFAPLAGLGPAPAADAAGRVKSRRPHYLHNRGAVWGAVSAVKLCPGDDFQHLPLLAHDGEERFVIGLLVALE